MGIHWLHRSLDLEDFRDVARMEASSYKWNHQLLLASFEGDGGLSLQSPRSNPQLSTLQAVSQNPSPKFSVKPTVKVYRKGYRLEHKEGHPMNNT